jgi:hypothetical protein
VWWWSTHVLLAAPDCTLLDRLAVGLGAGAACSAESWMPEQRPCCQARQAVAVLARLLIVAAPALGACLRLELLLRQRCLVGPCTAGMYMEGLWAWLAVQWPQLRRHWLACGWCTGSAEHATTGE